MARRWVLVTTVCPGLMRTGSPRNADFKGQHQAEYAWFSISGALPLLSTSWLTRMGDAAAARHNELGTDERAG